MLFLSREEQIHLRILIGIVLIIGILFLVFKTNPTPLKSVAVESENEITIRVDTDSEINIKEVNQKGKVTPDFVKINSSSYDDLLCCPGIGPKLASQIIKERELSPFFDWRDFQDRINGISSAEVDTLKNAGVVLGASKSNNDL